MSRHQLPPVRPPYACRSSAQATPPFPIYSRPPSPLCGSSTRTTRAHRPGSTSSRGALSPSAAFFPKAGTSRLGSRAERSMLHYISPLATAPLSSEPDPTATPTESSFAPCREPSSRREPTKRADARSRLCASPSLRAAHHRAIADAQGKQPHWPSLFSSPPEPNESPRLLPHHCSLRRSRQRRRSRTSLSVFAAPPPSLASCARPEHPARAVPPPREPMRPPPQREHARPRGQLTAQHVFGQPRRPAGRFSTTPSPGPAHFPTRPWRFCLAGPATLLAC